MVRQCAYIKSNGSQCKLQIQDMTKTLCEYHLPLNQKSLTEEQFAIQINDLAKSGYFDFEGFIVPCGIEFHGRIDEDVSFENAEFNGNVDLSNCKLEKCAFFNRLIIHVGHLKFRSAEFDAGVDFGGLTVSNGEADFSNSKFLNGSTSFANAKFLGGDVKFADCEFEKDVMFLQTEFSGGAVTFIGSKFKGVANFYQAKFLGGGAEFRECEFSGKALFKEAIFGKGKVDFSTSEFKGKETTFESAKFLGDQVLFERCAFSGNLVFSDIKIKRDFIFYDNRLDSDTKIFFRNPHFLKSEEYRPVILFKRINFNSFLTHIYDVTKGVEFENCDISEYPLIIFRDCLMKELFFSDSDMSLFSFYKNAYFEESLFTSCDWHSRKEWYFAWALPLKFTRDRVLRDEELYRNYVHEKKVDYYAKMFKKDIALPKDYSEVADLYLRFRAAADKAKDYQLASGFYFNEFEMKRLQIIGKIRKTTGWLKLKKPLSWLFHWRRRSYEFYKMIAGYGERPLRSIWTFGVFLLLFSYIHIFKGIKVIDPCTECDEVPREVNIDYDIIWELALPWNWKFPSIEDFGWGVVFTLNRVIPSIMKPFSEKTIVQIDSGFWNVLLSICNAVILPLLLLFIGIGFKRHFRRF